MQSLIRYAISLAAFCCLGLIAFAQEEIRSFDVLIEVEKDGDIVVTETLQVNVEGRDIRRGIFRDLPANYRDEDGPGTLPYRYDILSVRKDGEREPYTRELNGNAVQIRIGDPDVYLDYRVHRYEIRYRVKNMIRYNDSFDELYWNATGSYWLFPINQASAEIRFPEGASLIEQNGYTGPLGSQARDYAYERRGASHIFRTTQPLGIREGLSVSVKIEKGLIDPPSLSDRGWLWWARNGALTALIASFLGLLGFYYRSFERVGRDPVKGPVFPQYEPPKGYSPAAAHHIYYRGLRGHDGLIASLMYLASKGHMRIDVDREDKKKTTLAKEVALSDGGLTAELKSLYNDLFADSGTVKLGEKYDADFTKAYTSFRKKITRKYGASYFKWNLGYLVLGGILTLGTIIFAIAQASYWSSWHTLLVIGLVALNGLFMYLMPAPTRKGQDVRTHLQGFRLYMEKAEKLQLNAVEVGGDAPPPMTVKRYETFLPFAVALGVEKPWTKHFERLIPEEAKTYDPTWTNMNAHTFGSIGGMTDNMVSGMNSGVSSAMPQSSSSSGGGGGGFSGGGGGGGGGGGW
ncbi:MAG: DUF2207 domain-containing protein [Henriciella sp.]|nr:DUF2207 domain-containing protein [Henriciella sp.]